MLPLLLLVLSTLALGAALPWGPGVHLELAARVRRRKSSLPNGAAKLISEHYQAWLYGNIAADIINFKAYGGPYNSCHRWSIVSEMRELADSPREEAFALGYLAHLAADTIAHNHFVPYHLARYARGRQLGHLYWEMNADRFVPERRWEEIRTLKADRDLYELDRLVNATVPRRALSMGTNKVIFNHVLLVSSRDHWRTGMARLHPRNGVALQSGFLELFLRAAQARIELSFRSGGMERLAELDTSGHAAQRKALGARRALLTRHPLDRAARVKLAQDRAAPFLVGMQSPPPARAQASTSA